MITNWLTNLPGANTFGAKYDLPRRQTNSVTFGKHLDEYDGLAEFETGDRQLSSQQELTRLDIHLLVALFYYTMRIGFHALQSS